MNSDLVSQCTYMQVVNDIALLPDDVIDVNGLPRSSIAAPMTVVTVVEVTQSDWSVSSSGGEVLPGDIVVEVRNKDPPGVLACCAMKRGKWPVADIQLSRSVGASVCPPPVDSTSPPQPRNTK